MTNKESQINKINKIKAANIAKLKADGKSDDYIALYSRKWDGSGRVAKGEKVMLVNTIRLILTIVLIYCVYGETGWATTLIISLIALNNEIKPSGWSGLGDNLVGDK